MAQTLRVAAGLLLLYISGCHAIPDGVEQAVEQSLKVQDYRLIVRGGRGGSVPSVADRLQAEARMRCGIRYLEGFGDVIEIGKEAEFEQRVDYATRYNRRMLEKCMPEAISGQ
ncbi:hypothetical protein [Aeromonas jandaei]|uniref:hypothetical protein n=1 Tax=Aeromonas jandaei TaxID=650 RepID=UPI003BA24FCA